MMAYLELDSEYAIINCRQEYCKNRKQSIAKEGSKTLQKSEVDSIMN